MNDGRDTWRRFMRARADMLTDCGDWRRGMAESLRALSEWEADGRVHGHPGHWALLRRTARGLLARLDALPEQPTPAQRLELFEAGYRFTRIGQRLFP